MAAATPSLPLAPVPVGHFTVLSEPTLDSHSLLEPTRKPVKPLVVPDSSERWTTVMLDEGRLTPRFCFAISGSFHFFTFPRKMSASVAPSSFRPDLTPLRLEETVIAPNAVGTCTGAPFFLVAVISSSFIGGSLPAKTVLLLVRSEMPWPEPT